MHPTNSEFCSFICMLHLLTHCLILCSLLLLLPFNDISSISLQDQEKLSRGLPAELTPLSSRRSCKGTSPGSSHLHLSAVEMLSLRSSDPLPQKLLAHLAEGGGADLCALSPYMVRLSGAGFAYYAPGPETSVWRTQTLKLFLGIATSASQGSREQNSIITMCIF